MNIKFKGFDFKKIKLGGIGILPLLVMLTFSTNLFAQKSGNPVLKGWYADPEVAVFGQQYWIYPTLSAPRPQQVYMNAFSSSDLVNWTKHNQIIDTTSFQWAWKAMWAPAVVKKGEHYFIFFAANDIQSEDKIGGIGIGISDKPEGPFKDYLGKPFLNKIENGAQPIDQFIFKDVDGQYYMIYGGWGHCNIVKLNDDFTELVPYADGTIFKEITPEGYVEGSVMFIRNGKYYFMWSEGIWSTPDYHVAYAISDNPLGPFKRIGTILETDPKIANGAGHHSILNIPETDEWYIVYHRRPMSESASTSRMTCIDKMEFDKDGYIKPIKMTFDGVEARPFPVNQK
ncbi:glycoside hydrolase family 43 protein [Sunxiuqinia sp. A32]|uniref:glycoside hydrolase family 43 protein n=1 Tax=Sunxiuqinia sp. A32 TaxID=3461496 RepID=UPI004046740D